ncbi:outer membrane beta-barrel protein [Helicobacter cappadocius]|uniref:Outer membrane beta-barrel protein n=1 Tax=Helicobacter cappadocius TaxID=3063998 RepID=A0AA90T5B4_9HELI|nr:MULTISPECIES: outer membrane beta-barrel protein [unclassified Helicobacter]MDO7253327.1 outer membrane beta-barrel protein [Helicobacter sp. faydin-H75]MDP2539243.1 outer membrane beta-barrel protein [Helicobacter sp. faydin-H76]
MLVLSSLTSLADARFFLGIDGGYSMDKIDVKTEDIKGYGGSIITPGSFTKNAYLGNGYLFNINLGTEHHFDKNNYVGFRWFLAGGYGRTTLINQSNNLIQYPSNVIEANLGLDLLLDVIKFGNNSIGLFGGVEGGVNGTISDAYYYDRQCDKYPTFPSISPSVFGRVGVSLLLANHHRVEFVTKIPIYELDNSSTDYADKRYKSIKFMFGYKFVF